MDNESLKNELDEKEMQVACPKKRKSMETNIHKFKKKKLKQMQIDPEHNKLLKQLESLIAHKSTWKHTDVTNLLKIMTENFEIVEVYGSQVEKAILEFVDMKSVDMDDIRQASWCMSKFVNIKKSNGTPLFRTMISSLRKLGTEYFDYFNVASNLNSIDITLISEGSKAIFDELTVNDETIKIIINRISFVLYTMEIIMKTSDVAIKFPVDLVVSLVIAFISTSPQETIDNSSKSHHINRIPYFVSSHFWKLLNCVYSIKKFRCLLLSYVPNICELIKIHLSDDNSELIKLSLTNDDLQCWLNLKQWHQEHILTLICTMIDYICLSKICSLIEILLKNTINICKLATTNADERVVVLYMKIFNSFIRCRDNLNVQECIDRFSGSFIQLKTLLDYLKNRSIFFHDNFLSQYNDFMKLSRYINHVQDVHVQQLEFNTDIASVSMDQSFNDEIVPVTIDQSIEHVPDFLVVDDLTMDVDEKNIEPNEDEREIVGEINEIQNVELHQEHVSIDMEQEMLPQSAAEIAYNNFSTEVSLEEMLSSFVPF